MEKNYCNLHNIEIVIYNKEEQNLFVDDNRQQVVIFIDNNGKRYLKRMILDKCDESCPIIQELLNQKGEE